MSVNAAIRVFLLAAAPLACVTTSAEADFVIKNAPPQQASPASSAAMAPITDPGDPGYKQTITTPGAKDSSTSVHWKIAYGFGDHVPLAFACRQIVPQAVKVTFGPGADPQLLVSWKGGNTWNEVLRAAVKPLGLRLIMTYMAVRITK